MNIGDKIKELRKEKGYTQEELAIKCGLSKNGLWNYENNKRKPNTEILNKIAAALEVSIVELIIPERTLTNLIFISVSVDNNKDDIFKFADIDAFSFKEHVLNGDELPEDTLIKLIDALYSDKKEKFLHFYQNNYDLLSKHSKLLKFCRQKKKEIENTIFKEIHDEYTKYEEKEKLNITIGTKSKARSALASNRLIQNSLLYNFVLSILIAKYHTNSIEDLIDKLKFNNIEQLAAFILNDAGKYLLSAVNASLQSIDENPEDLSFNIEALNSEIENYKCYFSDDAFLNNLKSMVYAENKEGE